MLSPLLSSSNLLLLLILLASSHITTARSPSPSPVVISSPDPSIPIAPPSDYDEKSHEIPPSSPLFWVYLGTSLFLVCFAGLMSGLTLGLLSLDMTQLRVLSQGGEPQEKIYAIKIMPILKHRHLLLVTLLLCNAVAMEALPIFLDRLVNPIIAVAISVSFVLIMGEVVPQAICSRYGLAIGANLALFVKILMGMVFIIAWPISKILDWTLGKHSAQLYRNRAQLKELVSLHAEPSAEGEAPITKEEVSIIRGALDMREKLVKQAMTPIQFVYMLDVNRCIDRETIREVLQHGHSRVPVYEGERHNLLGVLLIKDLTNLDPAEARSVRSLSIKEVLRVNSTSYMYSLLHEFQQSNGPQLAIVVDKLPPRSTYDPTFQPPDGEEDKEEDLVIGVITLEDVLGELIQIHESAMNDDKKEESNLEDAPSDIKISVNKLVSQLSLKQKEGLTTVREVIRSQESRNSMSQLNIQDELREVDSIIEVDDSESALLLHNNNS